MSKTGLQRRPYSKNTHGAQRAKLAQRASSRVPTSRSEPQAAHHSEWKKPRRARGAALPFPLSPGGERVRVRGRLATTVLFASNSTLAQRTRLLSRSSSDEESRVCKRLRIRKSVPWQK